MQRSQGEPVDATELAALGKAALTDVVRKQLGAGIDIGNNGEQQREAFFLYVQRRMSGFGGAKVDAGIFADGARERAQIGNGGEGVFRLATAHLGVGLAQPVVEVVLIKSAEGKIIGRGFVPFGRKFVEAALDQTFFFGGERAGEGEGLLFFVPGAIVVAENGPGFGQGGMGEREGGRIFDGFLQRIDGTFGVHAAQLVDAVGI